jgi:hypothetical protein
MQVHRITIFLHFMWENLDKFFYNFIERLPYFLKFIWIYNLSHFLQFIAGLYIEI